MQVFLSARHWTQNLDFITLDRIHEWTLNNMSAMKLLSEKAKINCMLHQSHIPVGYGLYIDAINKIIKLVRWLQIFKNKSPCSA